MSCKLQHIKLYTLPHLEDKPAYNTHGKMHAPMENHPTQISCWKGPSSIAKKVQVEHGYVGCQCCIGPPPCLVALQVHLAQATTMRC